MTDPFHSSFPVPVGRCLLLLGSLLEDALPGLLPLLVILAAPLPVLLLPPGPPPGRALLPALLLAPPAALAFHLLRLQSGLGHLKLEEGHSLSTFGERDLKLGYSLGSLKQVQQ